MDLRFILIPIPFLSRILSLRKKLVLLVGVGSVVVVLFELYQMLNL
jgi:hypothetical protein